MRNYYKQILKAFFHGKPFHTRWRFWTSPKRKWRTSVLCLVAIMWIWIMEGQPVALLHWYCSLYILVMTLPDFWKNCGMPLKQLKRKHRKPSVCRAVSYRIPLPVVEVSVLPSGDCYSVCPRCDSLLEREYMKYCDRCGQCLGWEGFDHAKVINWPRKKSCQLSISSSADSATIPSKSNDPEL